MKPQRAALFAIAAAALFALLACGPLSFGDTKSQAATLAARQVETAVATIQAGKPTLAPTAAAQKATKTPSAAASGACQWTGTWSTTWGDMQLVQKGKEVTGTYETDSGKLKGTVSGSTFTGTWSEAPDYTAPDNAGDVKFTMSADCKSFTGLWRYGSEGDWSEWDGERK